MVNTLSSVLLLKMDLIKYIHYINIIVWFLIPIRQFKTRLFLFFLILALVDPFLLGIYQFVQINSILYYLFCAIILLYPTLFEIKKSIRIILIVFFLILSFISVQFSIIDAILIQIIIHLMIFIFFLNLLVIYYSRNRQVLFFHLILVIYQFSVLLKFYVYYSKTEIGEIYFFATTAFEILIGLFFILFNENNSPKFSI